MKRILLLGLAAAFLMAAGSALAQEIIPMNFDGGYSGALWSGGTESNVATGFYSGSINGVSVGHGNGQSPGMICDDYYDNIPTPDNWTAAAYQVSSLNSSNIGNTLFGGSTYHGNSINWANVQSGWNAITGYEALAYLVSDMFNYIGNQSMQSSISQAIWYLTSVAAGQNVSGWHLDSGALALISTVKSINLPTLSTYTTLWLYTTPFDPANQQEMWGGIPVPEGGTAALYLLLAGLACAGAVWQSRGTARLEGRA